MFKRYDFRSEIQQEYEPFVKFLLDVQIKAEACNFGSLRDSLMHDDLVCGTEDGKLRA